MSYLTLIRFNFDLNQILSTTAASHSGRTKAGGTRKSSEAVACPSGSQVYPITIILNSQFSSGFQVDSTTKYSIPHLPVQGGRSREE